MVIYHSPSLPSHPQPFEKKQPISATNFLSAQSRKASAETKQRDYTIVAQSLGNRFQAYGRKAARLPHKFNLKDCASLVRSAG